MGFEIPINFVGKLSDRLGNYHEIQDFLTGRFSGPRCPQAGNERFVRGRPMAAAMDHQAPLWDTGDRNGINFCEFPINPIFSSIFAWRFIEFIASREKPIPPEAKVRMLEYFVESSASFFFLKFHTSSTHWAVKDSWLSSSVLLECNMPFYFHLIFLLNTGLWGDSHL